MNCCSSTYLKGLGQQFWKKKNSPFSNLTFVFLFQQEVLLLLLEAKIVISLARKSRKKGLQ